MTQLKIVIDKLYINPVILSKERMDNLKDKIKLAEDNLQSARDDNDQFDVLKYENRLRGLVEEIRKLHSYKQILETDEIEVTKFFEQLSQPQVGSFQLQLLRIFLEKQKQELARMEFYNLRLTMNELLDELFQDDLDDEKRKLFEANEDLEVAKQMLQDAKYKGDFNNYTIIENEIEKIYNESRSLSEKIQNQRLQEKLIRKTIAQEFKSNPQGTLDELKRLILFKKNKS